MNIIKKYNRLLSCDPSINNLGMAIWNIPDKKLLGHMLMHPEKTHKGNEYDKSLSMYNQMKRWIEKYSVNRVIMENPEHWAVAGFQARETGSMVKLSFVCGMLYSLKNELDELKLVTPREWKSQLPKDVMANRLYEEYIKYGFDLRELDANVADAIGLGHFYLWGSV